MNEVKLGKYEHFKGSICEVIGIAKHSETLEEMVVYNHYDAVKGEKAGSLWVRPIKMFLETVEKDGKEIPRFRYIGE